MKPFIRGPDESAPSGQGCLAEAAGTQVTAGNEYRSGMLNGNGRESPAIDDAAAYLRLYKVKTVRRGAREMAAIIVQSKEELHRALQHLEKRDGIMKSVVEINRLENEADRLHSELIGRLFDEERDPIEIIKWQKILSVLEQATDRCEDVANVLESVVVKYS